MAFDLVAAYAQATTPFFVKGQAAQTLTEAPQQITLKFSPGVKIDASTLGSIAVVRSGGAGDGFGVAGSQADVTIVPGSITVGDLPDENQVVIRFADTLLDDTYRITVGAGLKSVAQDTATPTILDFRLDLGAFVVSVVPQPLTRTGSALAQDRNVIAVYFNRNDPLQVTSAQTASSYRLFEVNAATGDDVSPLAPQTPSAVNYDPATGKAVLTFAAGAIQDGKLYRLQIGAAEALVAPAGAVAEGSDNNSSFATALDLGSLGVAGKTVTGSISPPAAGTLPTPAGSVDFPTQIGTIDEPGHRQENYIKIDSHEHGLDAASTGQAQAITVKYYNFKAAYGTDGQGNTLQNAISETQKQRAREIFELYSLYTGIRFVESADQGLTVVTGDVRALDKTVPPNALGGIGGWPLAIMSSERDWGSSEYGGAWFTVAMHEIGHALGLDHSYDVPSIMGAGLSGEPVFPGDYDKIHFAQLYPANGSDVDMYRFNLAVAGTVTAETVIARPGQPLTSKLDSVLSLYREVNGKRELIARNDDYYGRDSFIGLALEPGTYFIAVSSTGNTSFNPEVSDSGYGGRSDGDYTLKLGFAPRSTATTTLVDQSGTVFDGDRDGKPGGAFNFWFTTAASTSVPATNKTIFVDKASAAGGDGTLAKPFNRIDAALAAAAAGSIVRIVGNTAGPQGSALPYLVGTSPTGVVLEDGATFNVPKGVTVMIDEGAVVKLRAAIIDVGSSSLLVDRSRAAIQVLGTPDRNVILSSYHDDTVGTPTTSTSRPGGDDGIGPAPVGGDWGGIVLRKDSDAVSKKAFVNSIANASIRYGGGQVVVDSVRDSYAPIQLESTRPAVAFNTITDSAGAAISADPDSFEESNGRVGPDIRGNRLVEVRPDGVHQNSINGLFVKIRTNLGEPLDRLDVQARFKSTDIVYVITENLLINGGVGGYERKVDPTDGVTKDFARLSGRLAIDPGVVVKLQGSRIELERGTSQLIAEGTPGQRVIFTSLGDNRFGAGGTFDTNGNLPDVRAAGDWGGIVLDAASRASIDYAYVAFGGGTTPIQGSFARFNVIETRQGDLRVAHSRIENNAAGTIFVQGAQPVILGNDFRNNGGAVVSANANALSDVERPDPGRSTGLIDRDARYDDNRGPLIRDNRLPFDPVAGSIGGLVVRGEEITVESVWDDTDIVHVLQNEIIVQNFHTATGIRLLSRPDASLVVKLAGATAGFTAAGYQLDIEDRIGGTVQVVGQPGYPVVLTSLKDDTVGASVDPLGRFVKDTGNDGATAPAPGDWRSLAFYPYSNDRNVAIVQEAEKPATGGIDVNGTPAAAQALGVLAPNFASGGNTSASAQEKSGDDNRRLGFEVHGRIATDDVSDVDVYGFWGYSGSEVWLDVDKTSPSLDSMIELLDASGAVKARSIDARVEGGTAQETVAGVATSPTVYTFQLASGLPAGTVIRPESILANDTPAGTQSLSVDAAGNVVITNIGRDAIPSWLVTFGTYNAATGILTLTYDRAPQAPPAFAFSYAYSTTAFAAATTGLAAPLAKDASLGGDYYTLNPKDPGMRVVLPSLPGQAVGTLTQYFVRVRSQPRYQPATTGAGNGNVTATSKADYEKDLVDPAKVKSGATNGNYELRIRLRQRDEKPGSTVRYADIRYPTVGIDVQGLPRHSPLVGETGEIGDASGTFGSAQYVGNLLQSDLSTISVAGAISAATDVDWYSFALNFEQIQSIAGVNSGQKTWATVFDLDYADGFRGDLTISVFNDQGQLLYVGRDSNVASDQPGAGQGNDFDNTAAGSVGKLDPFIGSVQMPAGNPTGGGSVEGGVPATPPDPSRQLRYYVAVSSNQRLPSALDAYFKDAATNSRIRMEPVDSVLRIAEDHIGFSGYKTGSEQHPGDVMPQQTLFNVAKVAGDNAATSAQKLGLNVTPFTLSDVTLFVYTASTVETVDAMRGGNETTLSTLVDPATYNFDGDLAMRPDGKLFRYRQGSNAGMLYSIDTGTGAPTLVGDDNIPTPPAPNPVVQTQETVRTSLLSGTTTTFQLAQAGVQLATANGVLTYTDATGGIGGTPVTYSWGFTSDAAGQLTFTLNNTATPPPPGFPAPLDTVSTVTAGTLAAKSTVTVNWSSSVLASNLQLTVQYSYQTPTTPNPNAITSGNVDALAFQRLSAGGYGLFYSVYDGAQSYLYSASATTGAYGTKIGALGSRVTGLAFVGTTLYGVNTAGRFLRIGTANPVTGAFALNVQTIGAGVAGADFQGLTPGPQNLQGGTFADKLFAITGDGTLYCFDTTGTLQTVFDANNDGVADATSIATGAAANVYGLAFSPLDINLWHPTTRRGLDDGHGINQTLDQTRNLVGNDLFKRTVLDGQGTGGDQRKFLDQQGGVSMYFGLEKYVKPTADTVTPYLNYQSTDGQFGVLNGNWQNDLTTSTTIGNTYDLPGGAYGSLVTNAFSLAGSTYQDKPTLYFNYWLQTQNAQGAYDKNDMRDSARAFISVNGGQWQVLATNNSARSDVYTSNGELPNFISASSALTTANNQQVQELYDSGTWRQARVDLGKWAGSTNVRIRFDFSTAGEFDGAQRDANGNLVNDIAGYANTTGSFSGDVLKSRERGQNNAYEGFYVDDVIIGYAERGEMVTNAVASQTGFFDIATPAPRDGFLAAQSLTGAYQLEMRRGTEYGTLAEKLSGDVKITQTFDTNADLVDLKGGPASGQARLGDANEPRVQGQFLIDSNVIANAATYGIRIDAAAREAGTNAASPGTPRNLPVLNGARLVPGVVVTNNVVAGSSTGGILFSGDAGAGPAAAVPYGRIVNNTIYGGAIQTRTGDTQSTSPVITLTTTAGLKSGMIVTGPGIPVNTTVLSVDTGTTLTLSNAATATAGSVALTFSDAAALGTGITVTDNAAPTILNNLFANLATGIGADASSATAGDTRTVVGLSAYYQVATPVSGASETFPLTLPGDPFVNAAKGNFYLTAGTPAIDSAINSLPDRATFVNVTRAIGMPEFPVVAPERDLYGQLRGDDPLQASFSGLGSNVFKDRGAIDRVDFSKPWITLTNPLDQSTSDLEPAPDAVRLAVADAQSVTKFTLQLSDVGVGIDKATVTSAAFALTRNGVPLVDGTDYVFRYLESSNQVVFEAASVYAFGTYVITATTRASVPGVTGLLTDLANNTVLPNKPNNSTSFEIRLVGPPEAPMLLTGTPGSGQVTLQWQPPGNDGGSSITDYIVQYSTDQRIWTTFNDGTSTSLGATVTGLTNEVPYYFRVSAVNEAGQGPWAQTSVAITPYLPAPAPVGLAATRGNTFVTLTWTAPTGTGFGTIADYRVEVSANGGTSWTTFADGVSATPGAVVTGLTNGVTYQFRVTAITQYGPGSAATASATPEMAPAPVGLAALRGNTFATLTWTAPTGTWFGTITDYRVEVSANGGTSWTTFADGVSATPGAVVTGLTSGVAYQFRVTTITQPLPSSPTTVAGLSAVVAETPGSGAAPVSLAALRGNTFVTLTWTAPTGTWFGTITDYRVEVSANGGASWTTFADGVSATPGAVVTGLTNGVTYQFRVTTITQYGAALGATVIATPENAPAPIGLSALGGDTIVTLSWASPSGTWFGTITDYRVEVSANGGTSWTTFADGVSATPGAVVTGLTNGQTYQFRVTTITQPLPPDPATVDGRSATTAATPVGVPLAPTGLVASAGDSSITATWNVATGIATGGSPITGHRVEWSADNGLSWSGIDVGATPTARTITGLVNNTAYLVRVAARNAQGLGPFATASAPVTPRPLAAAPTRLTGRAGDGTVALAWTAPTITGGVPIVNYVVQYSTNYTGNVATATWVTTTSGSSAARATVSVLNGLTYVFRVAAVTVWGTGAFSTTSPALTPFSLTAVPTAPTNLTVTNPATRTARLSWTAPPANAGGPITGYVVQYRLSTSSTWVSITIGSPTTSATIQNLTVGASYVFRVQARNLAGLGAFSAEQTLRIAY